MLKRKIPNTKEHHTTLAYSRSVVPEHAIIIIAEGALQGGGGAQGHGGGRPCGGLLGLLVLLDLLAGCRSCSPLLFHLLTLQLLRTPPHERRAQRLYKLQALWATDCDKHQQPQILTEIVAKGQL